MVHPDDSIVTLSDKPSPDAIRSLSRIDPLRALAAIAGEWLLIAAAITLCEQWGNPILYVAAVIFIGVRQHALMILGHEASHYTLLPKRLANDWVGDVFLLWPTFLSVGVYRHFHRDHHRYLASERDANRILWRTHAADGSLTREWTYPKSVPALLGKLLKKLCLGRGTLWMIKGTLAMYARPEFRRGSWWYALARTSYYVAAASLIAYLGIWREFLLYWVLPFCSWHVMIQYVRLICEHTAVRSTAAPYHLTRTTIPRLWERLLIVPHNIGYHHEHHWYPSVPCYNLPRLHALLRQETRFGQCADIVHGVVPALRVCTDSGKVHPAAPGLAD